MKRFTLASAGLTALAFGVFPISGAQAEFIFTPNQICTDATQVSVASGGCAGAGKTQASGGNPSQPLFAEQINTTSSGGKNSFDWTWHALANTGTQIQSIDATGVFTVESWTTTDFVLRVDITNTTVPITLLGGGLFQAGIFDFGVNTTPDATGVTGFTHISGAGKFDGVAFNQTDPSFGHVDACAFTATHCPGGSFNTTLQPGQEDVFQFDIQGNWGPNNNDLAINLADITTKWQGTQPLSFELPGAPGTPTTIPEPGALALLSAALLGLALVRRRSA